MKTNNRIDRFASTMKHTVNNTRSVSWLCMLAMVILIGLTPVQSAVAVNLPGSDFEIDTDANLKNDDGAPSIDWADVNEIRKVDLPSGSATDDAFGMGTAENTEPPKTRFGGIPPNKSDLKVFGVQQEQNAFGNFLHLFWTRVQDPSGTTLMDFEFNQSLVLSSNDVTPIRLPGDFLILYELSNGGTVPNLFKAVWLDGSEGLSCEAGNSYPCWGEKQPLIGNAIGSINTSTIPAGESDGLGELSPRTFGEASISLDDIFGDDVCASFGSAYLKSRSSDAFNAAIKDYIAPEPVNVSNCAQITIVKEDDIGNALLGAEFTLFVDADPMGSPLGIEDIDSVGSCITDVTGVCTISDIFAGEYWIVETQTPTGHDTAAPQLITVTADENQQITFVNNRQPAKINIHKQDDDDPANPLADAVFTLFNDLADVGTVGIYDDGTDTTTGKTCTSDASGNCMISDILPPGDYCVVETTTPAGYGTADPQCINLSLNETVNLTFVDPRLPAKINIHKQDDDDPANPLAGAIFTLFNDLADVGTVGIYDDGTDTTTGKTCTSDASGNCMISDILPPGDYCVVETTTPAGYDTADPQCINLSLNQTVNLTFVDPRQPAQINIHKQDDDDPANPLADAVFTLFNDLADVGTVGIYDDDTDTTTGKTCTSDLFGDCMISNILPPGNYCVVETTTPADHDTANPQCFSLILNQTLNLTFVNPRQTGAILITKTRKHKAGGGDVVHPGVTFTVNGVTGVTDDNGQVCFNGLLFKDYTVEESVPSGYVVDGINPKTVNVNAKSTCGDGNEAKVAFVNIPLTDILVQVNSQVPGGTASTISCVNAGGTSIGLSAGGEFIENSELDINGLRPGIYTCTINIDP